MVTLDSDDILCIEETNVTVRSYRHRTTIPSKIFKLLDLKQGDTIRWIAMKDGTIYVTKLPHQVEEENESEQEGV
ncbi:MAG: AbrB/MazE/SpoVT family DNA-binding domain-containing protein [Methanoculleaceae archaeon]